MEDKNAKLKQYLLGDLARQEAEAIDLQIIRDTSFEDRLHFAENELIENYLDESLSPSEVELFKKNFLISAEREAHLQQIVLLKNYARAIEPKMEAKSSESNSNGFRAALQKFFTPPFRPVSFALPLIILGLAIGAIFYVTTNKQTALEKEFAQLNQADLTNLENYSNLTNINLFAGVYRDAGAAGKLNASNLTEKVLMKLDLPVKTVSSDRFKIQVIRNGEVVFTQDNVKFYVNPHGRELRLLLPSSVLKTGEQQIKVQTEKSNESPVFYNLVVE